MIVWLLLVSLFHDTSQDRSSQETGVCLYGPQNLTLTGSDQKIEVTWEDHPSCSKANDELTYELMVLIADKQVHHEEIAVMPDQIASIHSWKWMSHLMVECAPHLVKLRSKYKKQASPWKEAQILPENPELPEVFPKDRVFKVGSTVTFCCIVPMGQILTTLMLDNNDSSMNKTKPYNISSQTYVLTEKLNQASQSSCTNVLCQTERQNVDVKNGNGACAYIGYPPDDRDLQCETRDLESVDCHWTVGRKTEVSTKSPTVYHLRSSTLDLLGQCADGSKGTCSHKVQLDVGERKWTLTAQNKLGKVELSDSADLTERVRLFAPKNLRASFIQSRNVTLEWEWEVQQYYSLDIRCQFNISQSQTSTVIVRSGVGLHYTVLNDLIPLWTYNVTARCGTTQHFWKWGDSTRVDFLTKGDVPDALDVWMQKKEDEVLIMWQLPLANQSHGLIEDYEVTWVKTTKKEQQNRTKVYNESELRLNLDINEEYVVTVTARNMKGSSSPSTITIPRTDRTESVPIYRINGSNGSFNLSWSASPDASCGYIVEWSPTSGHHRLDWLKVPLNKTTARIYSKKLTDGIRYSISVYACTQGAPLLLERREGYVRQEKIKDNFLSLKREQLGSGVQVVWEPRNKERAQSAFIQGYVLYCLDDKNNVICNVRTVHPEATSLTATRLPIGSYTLTVKALTELGECGSSSTTATLNSLTDDLVKPVLISLLSIICLLSIIAVLLCRHWTCIMQNVYPPIPKPVLTGKWLTSLDESTYPFHMDPCHYNEEDVATVTELHCNSKDLENDYFGHEIVPFVLSQAPKGYYNQENCSQPLLSLPSAACLSQPESPSSQFGTVFPNLSYNLILQTGEQQSDPGLENGTQMDSSGYQPQRDLHQTTKNPESRISCEFAYVLVPQFSPN